MKMILIILAAAVTLAAVCKAKDGRLAFLSAMFTVLVGAV